MNDTLRIASPLDRLISLADHALKNALGQPPAAGRPTPAARDAAADEALSIEDRRRSAALMRVNHAGEIAAQALYHGQALVAADPKVRDFLLEAAREEGDHLVWCAERLEQLGSRTSLLGPVWYIGSALIGALAGWSGDAISLGFIAETERQVEGHIDEHLKKLPDGDLTSRAILAQMKHDESEHREHAMARGGAPLRAPIPTLMRATAKIMTGSAYWI
jgi:ubiquinone biosynthesis monooxygenase Coq7